MRRFLLFICPLLVLSASVAFAQTKTVGLYSNTAATDCNLYDVPGLHEVHVIYNGDVQIGAMEFQIVQTQGASLTYLGDSVPDLSYLTMGAANTGIGVAWSGCKYPPVHVLTVFYYGQGNSSICGLLDLENDPRAWWLSNPGHVRVVTQSCEGATDLWMWVDAMDMNVNPAEGCSCEVAGSPTPVEPTTWGNVKALYGTGVE